MSFGKDANEFVRAYLTGQQMVNENRRLDVAEKRADEQAKRDDALLAIQQQNADSGEAYKKALIGYYNTKGSALGSGSAEQDKILDIYQNQLQKFNPITNQNPIAVPIAPKPTPQNPAGALPMNIPPGMEPTDFQSKGGVVPQKHSLHHVVGEAMQHIQNRFALHAATGGAIPDRAQQAQLAAFHGNQGAIAPEAMDALRQRHGSNEKAIEGIYSHYANQGNPDAAKEAASGVMQAARARSMDFGKNALAALDKRDYQSAAKSLIDAYNEVPDDHTFTGEVNPEGVGRAVIVNNKTGKPVQQLELNPQIIAQSAQNFASGQGFYPHMVEAIKSQPVERAFTGGMMGQGVSSALEDNVDTADVSSDELPTPELASDNTTEPAVGGNTPSGNSGIPNFVPILPGASASQIARAKNLNRQLYFQARQQASLDKEMRSREATKERTDPHYAFKKDIAPLVDRYSHTEGSDRYNAGFDIMDARVAYEMRGLKQTAKERDPEHITAQLDDAWGKLNPMAKEDPNVKRADGTNMTNVKDRAFVELDKLPSVKRQFYDVMYGLLPYNENKHTPETIMQTVHDIAFKKSARPEFDPNSGTIKYGDVSLVMPGATWKRILNMRNEAKAGQKQLESAQAERVKKDEQAPQRKAEAISMLPEQMSADQQYAVKYGYNPNTSPDEVDKRRQWGALQ